MILEAKTISEQEVPNGRREDLYVTDDSSQLLGSCVRALGKPEWNIAVFPSVETASPYFGLQKKLQEPNRLDVFTPDALKVIPQYKPYDLVLIDDPSDRDLTDLRGKFFGKTHIMVRSQQENPDEYTLVSDITKTDVNPHGVIAYTGDGKGKSTGAFGIALNTFIKGGKVAVVQWFKETAWNISEHTFSNVVTTSDNFAVYPMGSGFFGAGNLDREKDAHIHEQSAAQAVSLAAHLLTKEYDVIVLDEFVDTVKDISKNIPVSLLTLDTVRAFLQYTQQFPNTTVVTTGRSTNLWQDLIQTSYEVKNIRHPFTNRGEFAKSGLDF